MKNPLGFLKNVEFYNPATDEGRVKIMANLFGKGLLPPDTFKKIVIDGFRSETKAGVKKGKDKATLAEELEKNTAFVKLVTETLGIGIEVFHEIIREETE